jgi:hypothetical protein
VRRDQLRAALRQPEPERHFHIVVLDGVLTRARDADVRFHPAPSPARDELEAIARRVRDRSLAWLRRCGYLDERPLDDRSNEAPEQTALDACAAIAIGRGRVATLPNAGAAEDDHDEVAAGKPALAVEHDGFNLHAGVRIEAGDDLGRERLCRYGARPPLSIERLRRLPGRRVAYRLKYVSRGRGKHRIMSAMEFMARLAALIAPPRYPLVRYAGVLGPRNAWREDTVPRPREHQPGCAGAAADQGRDRLRPRAKRRKDEGPPHPERPREAAVPVPPQGISSATARNAPEVIALRPGHIVSLAPNVISVRHWDPAPRRRAVRGNTEDRLGEFAPKIVGGGCAPVPEVPGPPSRDGRHHRARGRPAHPRAPRHVRRHTAPRARWRPDRR